MKTRELAQTMVDEYVNSLQSTEFRTHVACDDKQLLKLPNKEARDIVWGSGDKDYEVIVEEPIEQGRWEILYLCIVKRKSDNTYWDFSYDRGATESQDIEPFEFDGDIVSIDQVFPHLEVKVSYI